MNYHPILFQTGDLRSTSLPRLRRLPAPGTVPTVGTAAFGDFVVHVADEVAEHGIGRVEPEVSDLARVARDHGVSLLSADVLADRSEPSVARERALGNVISALMTPLELPAAAA